jgi:CheY-like chemotaxis protein
MTLPPVLYAEDSQDDVFFMRRAWEMAGIPNPLITVKDGQQAIDYLAGQGQYTDRQRYPMPCLLLLDLKLSLKTGFDVLRWIRDQSSLDRLKVVIVSGSNQHSDMDLARSLGALDYIVKPSSPNRLLEIVRKNQRLWLGEGKGTESATTPLQ